MSNLSDAFETPVPYKENGLEVSFPRLDIYDLAEWGKEIYEPRKEPAKKLIPGNAPPTERFRMQRAIEFGEASLDDIADLLYTAPGARTCLEKSLAKAGKTLDEAKSIIRRIPGAKVQKLAMDVSGLFEKPPPAPKQGPQGAANDPLAQDQPGPSGDPTSPSGIGAGQGSSSASTSPNPGG